MIENDNRRAVCKVLAHLVYTHKLSIEDALPALRETVRESDFRTYVEAYTAAVDSTRAAYRIALNPIVDAETEDPLWVGIENNLFGDLEEPDEEVLY